MSHKSYKTYFICQSCGHEQAKWSGRCPQCQEWNTLVETVVSAPRSGARKPLKNPRLLNLSSVGSTASSRISAGIGEFDRVLGGGIVPGSVILLAGEPGVGKSTLLLQVAAALETETGSWKVEAGKEARSLKLDVSSIQHPASFQASSIKPQASVLYVSGEESPSQLKLRADRLGINTGNIQVLAETDVDALVSFLAPKSHKELKLLIIDSAQTLTTTDLSVGAGTISQVRECSQRLTAIAKEKNIPLILVGHVTKEGSVAGPKVLEHMVDVVLYLEGDKFHSFRLLRAHKNRFGSDQEVGVFAMGERGLSEIQNPSDAFLAERLQNAPGSVVTATMEGTRPVLVEIQALATPTTLAYPRRTASGFDYNRLNLLVAVLEKHLKLPLHQKDIYVNVASGFKISEPAADLACALAIISSVRDQPIGAQICTFGEVGLSGEVRKVSQSERRIKEAKKLGFTKIISPEKVRSVAAATAAARKVS